MSAPIGLYDDHRASVGWDGGGYPTIRLCEECAEELGADVSLVDTFRVGEEIACEECGSLNRGSAESDAE